jgi:hypothetical protein
MMPHLRHDSSRSRCVFTLMCIFRSCIQMPASLFASCRVAALVAAMYLPGGQDMTRLFVMSAAALGLLTGLATAQATETIITTAPSPAPTVVVPPPETLSTTTTKKSVGPDGSLGYSQSTTYNGAAGTTSETTTSTYPAAPPPPVTTQQTTTTTHYR